MTPYNNEYDKTFCVRGVPVGVGLGDDANSIHVYLADNGTPAYQGACHPLDWRRLVQMCSNTVARHWRTQNRHLPVKVKEQLVGPMVNRQLYPWWDQFRQRFDPEWVRLQKRLFSAFGMYHHNYAFLSSNANADPIYEYRAAAYAIAATVVDHPNYLVVQLEDGGFAWVPEFDWVSLYCAGGRTPYKALYQTLLALPPSLPRMLDAFWGSVLRRPLLTRFELLVWSQFSRRSYTYMGERNLEVFWRSSPEHMMTALERVRPRVFAEGESFSYRRSADVFRLVNWILDYPGEHNGDMRGMAVKSIEYHRNLHLRNQEWHDEMSPPIDPDEPFPVLVQDLPDGFSQLRSHRELLAEGELMDHCIGDTGFYSRSAHAGRAMHFHVEFNGESATCTVSEYGRIEALGPRNSNNAACSYAVKAARKLAKYLQERQDSYGELEI